mmetsp:Transcript_15035/g.37009  ORF Transcript_15035/g.37009 Transcript_15035/m.37009 type:complete len:218 (+) Transcript_15035:2142-2795(+)
MNEIGALGASTLTGSISSVFLVASVCFSGTAGSTTVAFLPVDSVSFSTLSMDSGLDFFNPSVLVRVCSSSVADIGGIGGATVELRIFASLAFHLFDFPAELRADGVSSGLSTEGAPFVLTRLVGESNLAGVSIEKGSRELSRAACSGPSSAWLGSGKIPASTVSNILFLSPLADFLDANRSFHFFPLVDSRRLLGFDTGAVSSSRKIGATFLSLLSP